MITTPGLSINFLKKECYTGSHAGLRYYLTGEDDLLKICVYPDMFCFEATPDEDKTWNEFPFSPEGLEEGIRWINEMWESIPKTF